MPPYPCGFATPVLSIFFLMCLQREYMDPHDSDLFDPESLRLPADQVGRIAPRRRPPRHRAGEGFLKGPIPWAWWATACWLPGRALQVASAVRYRAGWLGPDEIPLGLSDLERTLGVRRDSARRGLF